MCFRNYELLKRSLDKCLKSAVSRYPSTSNVAKAFKRISNHHGGTLIKIFDLR